MAGRLNEGYRETATKDLGGTGGTVPDVAILSDVLGQTVNTHEVAYFNGGAVLDDIPVQSRDDTDQVVFRGTDTCNLEVGYHFLLLHPETLVFSFLTQKHVLSKKYILRQYE